MAKVFAYRLCWVYADRDRLQHSGFGCLAQCDYSKKKLEYQCLSLDRMYPNYTHYVRGEWVKKKDVFNMHFK